MLRRFSLLPVLILALLGCNLITPVTTPPPLAGTPSPKAIPTGTLPAPSPAATVTTESATATREPQVTATQAATIRPSQIATRAATISVDGIKLSAGGPWLLFAAEDGIWAVNADGSGLTQVMPPAPYFRLGPAAPHGAHATVLTAGDSQGFHNLTLWLLSLPGGELKKIAELTNASTEPGPDAQFGDAGLDVIYALGQAAWAPDGKDLAFIGAQAGLSADLFKYNLDSGQVTRLTDGPSQAYSPSWSPDGKYVVQMGAPSFGTGAGYTMDGVWAAAADNSGVKLLYKPDSGGEDLLGWSGPEAFAVTSFYVRCSYGKVRTFNIPDGKSQSIFDGYYSRLASDPASGAALVAVDQFVAECTPGAGQGLFLARPGAQPRLLDENGGDATRLGWSPEAGLFYAFSNGAWRAFTPDGTPARLPEALNGEPVVSAGGKNWAWVDQDSGQLEASVGGAPAQRVHAGEVLLPTWSPDGQYLLFFGDGQLFAAGAPDLQPKPMSDKKKLAEFDVREWVG